MKYYASGESSNISGLMTMASNAMEATMSEDRQIAQVKQKAKKDIAWAIRAGLIKKTASGTVTPRQDYSKRKKFQQRTYTDAQIKAHLATFKQLRADGLSIAQACKVIGVSATAIRSWSGKDRL